MNAPSVTLIGNLTDDPELRLTPAGHPVVNFTVASTPRTLNKVTDEWEDGEPMFVRCTLWRQAAENVAETLQKGTRVILGGRLGVRTWQDREGGTRISIECQVDEIGPSLRWQTATLKRNARQSDNGPLRSAG